MTLKLPSPTANFLKLNRTPLSLTIGSYSCEVLNWGHIGPEYWRNYLHTHSFFEVCYAFRGEGIFRIGGSDHVVRTGDVFVARPGEPHEIVSSTGDPLGICYWAYALVLSDNPVAGGTDPLLRAFQEPGTWVQPGPETVGIDLHLLEAEVHTSDIASMHAIGLLTSKLILDTARLFTPHLLRAEAAAQQRLTPAQRTVERIGRYLRDNYDRPLCVRDVAAEVNLSERHTNRLFRAHTGESIVERLTRLRVERASQLLLDRRLPVKEVARAVGYTDVHYFTTLFHERTGMPPARFRDASGTVHLSD